MTGDRWWHRYLPVNLGNPARLAWQLLTESKSAARSAMWMAAAGIALTPFDLLLQRMERRRYAQAPDSTRPLIIVCGAPRSGTTLVAQFLINHLDVAYLNNLTSLFPRSPISANYLLGRWLRPRPGDYEAFYGKSRGLAGANDGLYVWDRWLGRDRELVPSQVGPGTMEEMREFFASLESFYQKPVVNKVNRLNTCAHLVAGALANARFVCVRRDPLFLAQSLLVAREKIMGTTTSAYGVQHHPVSEDPIEDVCLQVKFHELQIRQQADLCADRFSIVSYERFCEAPGHFLDWYRSCHRDLSLREVNAYAVPAFQISNKRRIERCELERMERLLTDHSIDSINVCNF